MKFPCEKCGLCCRNIGGNELMINYDRGDGVCKYLNEEDNSCNIYENRPLICRVDEMYEKVFHKFYSSKEEYYKENIRVCNFLKDKKRR